MAGKTGRESISAEDTAMLATKNLLLFVTLLM